MLWFVERYLSFTCELIDRRDTVPCKPGNVGNCQHLYDVIMRYALYGEEPTDLNGEQMRTFILIRPQLDANERKRQAKYKKKAIKKNNDEELNKFFTKTEDEENDNLRILNDIQYE